MPCCAAVGERVVRMELWVEGGGCNCDEDVSEISWNATKEMEEGVVGLQRHLDRWQEHVTACLCQLFPLLHPTFARGSHEEKSGVVEHTLLLTALFFAFSSEPVAEPLILLSVAVVVLPLLL